MTEVRQGPIPCVCFNEVSIKRELTLETNIDKKKVKSIHVPVP